MSQEGSEKDVWKIVADQRIAMLTTQEESGRLVSRPMACLARPEEGRIYFVTRIDAKVGEIGGSAEVNLGFADTHKNTYLSLSGTARTSQDREKLRDLWSMFTEAWLPEGPDGEDVALVTVEPSEAKLWDSTRSNLIYGAKVLKAVATQTPPSGGRIEEVDMGGSGDTSGASGTSAPSSGQADAYDEKMRESAGTGASSMAGPTV
ncbi:MAG: pyridoxamine 5'-phosphate oxidase family protein [Allosphingosinicella sp.]|uniref:pyridoxamine 5'-phosphate oxidase family protein n=1 Tax=Allosphingosinicella sp. TaxID=2823234 RepID=UPI003948B4E1